MKNAQHDVEHYLTEGFYEKIEEGSDQILSYFCPFGEGQVATLKTMLIAKILILK